MRVDNVSVSSQISHMQTSSFTRDPYDMEDADADRLLMGYPCDVLDVRVMRGRLRVFGGPRKPAGQKNTGRYRKVLDAAQHGFYTSRYGMILHLRIWDLLKEPPMNNVSDKRVQAQA